MKANLPLTLGTLALGLLLALGTACSRGQAPFASDSKSDQQLATEIQQSLQGDASLQSRQIGIQAQSGTVTLSGSVGNEMERIAAANKAAQVSGVRTVVNNLTVESASAAPPQLTTSPEPPVVYEAPRSSSRTSAASKRATPAKQPASTRATAPVATPRTSSATASNNVTDYSSASATTSQNNVASVPARPAQPANVIVPAGTAFQVRTAEFISSETMQEGDTFRGTLDEPVYVNDQAVIPAGADVTGRVTEVKSAGKFAGQSLLSLELARVSYNGRSYNLNTTAWSKQGSSRGKNTAAKVGGGAALGAIIGGIAGGGKGAAIGATIGAGAGTGVQAVTKGQQIELQPESLLRFNLQSSISVVPSSQSTNRRKITGADEQD